MIFICSTRPSPATLQCKQLNNSDANATLSQFNSTQEGCKKLESFLYFMQFNPHFVQLKLRGSNMRFVNKENQIVN